MKAKLLITAVVGLATVVNVLGQGSIAFKNRLSSVVIDGRTGLPVAPGVATAGLYYTTDLTATTQLDLAADAFILAATTPIAPSEAYPGIYSGGAVVINGLLPGQEVLLQVRGWSAQYATYAEALHSTDAVIGACNPLRYTVGGNDTIPTIAPNFEGFTLNPVPGPPLSITLMGRQVLLSWPSRGSNFVVEAASDVKSNSIWIALTNTPMLVGTNVTVLEERSGERRFYRLRKDDP